MSERFRIKPIEVDAVAARDVFAAARDDWSGLPDWLDAAYRRGVVLFLHGPDRIEIKTAAGAVTAGLDDWILRAPAGQPDVFESLYQRVPDEDPADLLRLMAFDCRRSPAEPEDLLMADLCEAGADALRDPGQPELDRLVVEKLAALAVSFADELGGAGRAT